MTYPPGPPAQPPYGGDPNNPYGYQPPVDPYAAPVSGDPTYGQYPGQTSQMPTYPAYPGQYSAPPGQYSAPPGQYSGPPGQYPMGYPAPPKKKRTGLIVGLIVGLVVVLCGGGAAAAYVLVQNNKQPGADTAETAVQGFLTAVFKSHNATEAGKYVCESARDTDDLNQLITKVTDFEKKYESPRTTWRSPTIENGSKGEASATVKLTFTTADERSAENQIRLLLVDDNGWWVCDVQKA